MKDFFFKLIDSPGKIITILLLILSFFVITKIQDCNGPENNTTKVTELETLKPSDEDKKLVGPGKIATGRLDLKDQDNRPKKWLDKKTHIVIAVDEKCNTCTSYHQVDKVKTFRGVDFESKIFLGYTPSLGLSIGYDQQFFRYGKFTTDILLTFPALGIALEYNLTNNIYVLGGGLWHYGTYKSITDIDTYAIILPEYKITPVLGVSFSF